LLTVFIILKKNIKKLFFIIDLHRIEEFSNPEIVNDPYGPKIEEDSNFEIRYILKNFPTQEYGSFCCNFCNILFVILLRENNGELRGVEIQTGSFTIIFENNSFKLTPNDYWSFKTYDSYIQEEIKRRNLEISE